MLVPSFYAGLADVWVALPLGFGRTPAADGKPPPVLVVGSILGHPVVAHRLRCVGHLLVVVPVPKPALPVTIFVLQLVVLAILGLVVMESA